MSYFTKTFVRNINGFDVFFTPELEDQSLQELLPDDTPAQIRGLQRRIDNGNAFVFVAEVSAHKAGLKLGTAYLGGCIYDSYEDFYKKYADEYFADLAAEAVAEAKITVSQLCADAEDIHIDTKNIQPVALQKAQPFNPEERDPEEVS